MGLLFRAVLVAPVGAFAVAGAAWAAGPEDLSQLSLEQLGEVQVTSVSKRAQAVSEAPASIFVIRHEDIASSGARNLPEILRLAPNLEVQQVSASRYVITARGSNGAPAAQNFSNKLLVLIDGRSVYSPLFSGVYWDMQGVLPEDIDRIEVISGPGATMWGANAVNGVINIITRSSAETQGGFLDAVAGGRGYQGALRFGGRASDALTWRVYAQSFYSRDLRLEDGTSANDHWSRPQAGFRVDWTPAPSDTLTLQGDGYSGFEAQAGAAAEDIKGGNLTARWTRTGDDGSSWQAQAYYDRAERGAEVDGSAFWVDTYDLDLQRGVSVGARQQLVWGGGYRMIRYKLFGAGELQWAPDSRTLKLANVFVQDTVALTSQLNLVAGVKLEDDAYVPPTLLPNVRLAWIPDDGLTVWAAISRAVRSPTPFDRDVVEFSAGRPLIAGGDFTSEKLVSYELGVKLMASARASLEVTAFYHDYDDLRTLEPTPATILPLRWANEMEGRAYGVEAWALYQATPWWRLSAGFNHLQEDFRFKAGASGLLGLSQAANDPRYQAQLRSTVSFRPVSLDAWFRYVSALRDPRVPGYAELNAQLAWDVTERLRLAIDGRNLLHEHHIEYVGGEEIPRSLFAALQWRF